MSSYRRKWKHKVTGDVHTIWAIDNHFGSHQYGYKICGVNMPYMEEDEFRELYEGV